MLGPSPCSPLAQAMGIETLAAQPGVADHRGRLTEGKCSEEDLWGNVPPSSSSWQQPSLYSGAELRTPVSPPKRFMEGPCGTRAAATAHGGSGPGAWCTEDQRLQLSSRRAL